MADVLVGYSFSRSAARYRSSSTGQFVSRTRIMALLDRQIATAEQRLGDIVAAMHDKSITSGMGQLMIRDELRRLHLQNAALGAGGIDRLSFREYGRAGRSLRDTYQRVASLTLDIEKGRVSLPQAMNRIQGYAGEARRNFFETQRDTLQATGKQYEQRRRLNARESCVDCIRYAGLGWQPLGTLPEPGNSSRCNAWCRCTMETREVTPEMIRERLGQSLRERMVTT